MSVVAAPSKLELSGEEQDLIRYKLIVTFEALEGHGKNSQSKNKLILVVKVFALSNISSAEWKADHLGGRIELMSRILQEAESVVKILDY